jgi:hypothetical protein
MAPAAARAWSVAALCAAWLALAAACGKERWSIKVGSDQDASKVRVRAPLSSPLFAARSDSGRERVHATRTRAAG